ncbi:MAG: hypothetical protein Q8P18_23265 [Pseudomonadota bacterium]|nr:hypothetical protein [Pseudomonadota bacterium]
MAESSRQKSSTSSTPTSCAAPAQAAVAPQRTGNAAAQDRLGLTAAAPTSGGTMDAALVAMGDMGAVVLDALPLGAAMRLAMRVRGAPAGAWVDAWVCAQPIAEVLAQAPDLLAIGLDAVWPVGFGVELDEAVSASHLVVTGGERVAIGVTRTAAGVSLSLKGGLQAGLAVGLGASLSGSMGDTALGGDLGASVVDATAFEATWAFDLAAVLRALGTRHPRTLTDMLLDRPVDFLGPAGEALVALAKAQQPSSWSADVRGVGEATGADAVGGLAHGEVGAKLDAGIKIGHEGGQSFIEGSTGGAGSAGYDNRVFEALRLAGLPEFTAAMGCRLRVRVSGSGVDLAAMAVENLRFTVATTLTSGTLSVEDAFETPSVAAAVAWIAAALNTTDTCLGEAGPSVGARDLPDVALHRSATRSVPAIGDITDSSVADELFELSMPDKRAFVTDSASAELTGELYVPVEAVRAALHGAALPAGGEGIEARVLDVERLIAAEVVGGAAFAPDGLPTLDLAAAAERVEVPKVQAVVKRMSRVGVGTGIKGGIVEEANVNAGLTTTEVVTLSPAIEAEQRRALFSA